MTIEWEEMSEKHTALMEEAIQLYDDAFPLDVREPSELLLRSLNIAKQSFPNHFRFVVGIEGGRLVSLATGHYLAAENTGFIVYLATHPAIRSTGVGTKTLLKLEALLNEDAKRAGNRSLASVILETEKEEMAHTEKEKEDCVKRHRFYTRNGYLLFEGIPYLQPPLHSSGQAVPMDLMIKSFQNSPPAKDVVQCIIRAIYREKYEFINEIKWEVLKDCLGKMGIEEG